MMLETIEEIHSDSVSQKILNLLADGWMPIKLIIPKLGVDRHTAYRRFRALEKHHLIRKSKGQHEASRYKIFGYDLTESGKVLAQEDKTVPSTSLKFPLHSFENNYVVDAKLYVYPDTKATMFSSEAAKYHFSMGLFNFLLEFSRDPKINLGKCRIILDCRIEPIAELDIYEFYNKCLSPSLESYINDRTFCKEADLSARILESPGYALNLIKLIKFTVKCYESEIGKENIELISAALVVALEAIESKSPRWFHKASSLIINVYLFMLASMYHKEGKLPEPEQYFELWYISIYSLEKLKNLYTPLREDLKEKLSEVRTMKARNKKESLLQKRGSAS